MSTYNVADMTYYNEYKQVTNEKININRYKFYEEYSTNLAEKIDIINQEISNFANKILIMAKEYTEDIEKGVIKSTISLGERVPKTVSFRAWLDRKKKQYNLSQEIDSVYNFGKIPIGDGDNYWIQHLTTEDDRSNFVNDVFHKILKNRAIKERLYFYEHDPLTVLNKTIREHPLLRSLNFPYVISSSDGFLIGTLENNRKATIDELKIVIEKLNTIQTFANKISTELMETFRKE